jgi:hypothetical protein
MEQPPRFNQRPASSIAAISDRRMSLHDAVGKIIPRLERIACKKETLLADPHLLVAIKWRVFAAPGQFSSAPYSGHSKAL